MDSEESLLFNVGLLLTGWNTPYSKVSLEINNTDAPVWKQPHNNEWTINIDDLLGKYEPALRKITLYDNNIKAGAKSLKCQYKALKYVVKLHEYAHAIVHLGITDKERGKFKFGKLSSKNMDKINASIDKELHEVFAQIITYNYLKKTYDGNRERSISQDASMKPKLDAFEKLEEHQSYEYRLGKLKKVDFKELNKCMELFKSKDFGPRTLEVWNIITGFIAK